MRKITRRKHLEMKIQSVPTHPNPKAELEQYSTPSVIAADLLWNALSLGDIENKDILDLGCGCGIFSIGSIFLGAKSATGVDIDAESVDRARGSLIRFDIDNADFIVSDVCDLDNNIKADTIIQNPPFGSQRSADKGADLKFVKKALDLSPEVLYSFHMASAEKFLINYYENLSFNITHILRYSFPIPKIYEFHKKESRDINVIAIRALL